MGGQKVVVIQDASREVIWSAIRCILHGFSLKQGDELTLLAVLHQVNNPSTSSLMGAGKFLGFRSKVDSGIFGANQKFVVEEVARKSDEYQKNEEAAQLSHQCKMQEIKFCIEVQAWPSPKVVAVEVAKEFKASWVILDRQMKKDKKYFLERLSCGISRMKRDNTIEQLRGPKAIENPKLAAGKSTTTYVTYAEMIPELGKNVSPNKSPNTQKTPPGTEQGGDESGEPPCENHQKLPLSKSSSSDHMLTIAVPSSSKGNTVQEEEDITTKTEQEMAEEQSSFSIPDAKDGGQTEVNNTGSPNELEKHTREGDLMGGFKSDQAFENSICSVCQNKRPMFGWKKEFTYAELHAATEGFSSENFLSEGGFGSVYRGELKNGLKIAVKQHNHASFQGEKEFKSEVYVLSKARHKNLVMLLGSCSEGSHRLLVYEYVCNGELNKHLSKNTKEPLNWDNRIKIALGAAKGLKYLHETNIIHRDVRPNNILVTHDNEALLGDFGLARTHHEDADDSQTKVVGTLGYLAPEYAESGKVSSKTDVYSFGVVLLQLITGRSTTENITDGESLTGWARPLLKDKNYPDLIDERIEDSHDMHQLFWMVIVTEKCLSKDPKKRWNMKNVVDALEYISEGNTTCIRDFSPPESDSISSIMDSPGSQNNSEESEEESPSNTRVSTLKDIISARKSRVSSSTSSEQSNHFGGKERERRKAMGMNNSELLYEEMLN
ncbi:Proline-rich receptor-like protein kinase PERK3 [Camellia lanceoleosa]|uniref:Proline-rich receptor-like protein kinase PERK3 n=1 Tax=Camellia lanceoleosa TaxID=1840588 RepID=A0ACC0I7R5_9ERIC|nr:Proline-rich receptor-like protein kinase PERK3 [Camellia lanceoleosa]